MATAQHIKALARSIADGDEQGARDVLRQVAARAGLQGKARFAEEIGEILAQPQRVSQSSWHAVAKTPKSTMLPAARMPTATEGLLQDVATYQERLSHLIVTDRQRERLGRVLLEQRAYDHLAHHDLRPIRKLLLYGPPGTGKSMTARVLAFELKLPLKRINLYAVFSKHFGETAARLHTVFEEMTRTRAVYLFDEFDALGSSRQGSNEVGEMGRIVNSLLQLIEEDTSQSVIVAATNLTSKIDSAFARRFDDIVRYELPDAPEVDQLVTDRLGRSVGHLRLTKLFTGLSHAEIVHICEDVQKQVVLGMIERVTRNAIEAAVERRRELRKEIG